MPPETKQEAPVTPEENGQGDTNGTEEDVVTVKKAEYDKLHETIGSLKRDLKGLKKAVETTETPKDDKPEVSSTLVEKGYLRTAGITDKEEVALALETAKKWGMSVDELVDDDDWAIKLDKYRTKVANARATTGVRGDSGGESSVKNSPEYWIAKGAPPTPDQVPDRKTRVTIARAMMSAAKNTKRFYND